MADDIVPPFLVQYQGRDTDNHIIQADLYGESVLGAGRLYTAAAHYCMFGFVPRKKYKKEVVVFATPMGDGSINQWMRLLPVIGGHYAIASQFYNEAISYVFGKVCDALKDMWTRQSEVQAVVERLAAALEAQAKANADVNTVLANGLVRAVDQATAMQSQTMTLHSKLIETLPALAAATKPHAVHLVVPIGVSCTSIAQFAGTPQQSVITEPEARLIRGEGASTVGQSESYQVNRVKEINVETGHCIVDVQGVGEVTGEIRDPVLSQPGNVYTTALDQQTGCQVTAKAVTTNGNIDKLVISDATP